jgi:steroid delta-isomerase-like uncharacterized protein
MDLKNFVRTWFASIDKRDWTTLEKLLASDHSFANSMSPTPLGKEEHLGMMQMMTGALTGQHELLVLVEEGDHIAVHGRWTGKHTAEFMGVPASGKTVNFTFTDILNVRNGQVVKEYLEFNPAVIMQQIGALQTT